jgi:Na+/pantothenate symporter
LSNIIPALSAIDPKLVAPVGPAGLIPLASLVILTSLGPWGLPQMTQKFYAVKNEKVISTASYVTFFFALLIAFGAYFTGSLSHLFYDSLDQVGGNIDKLMPAIISQSVPASLALIILLLVLSASMSTLASLVLVSSSAVAVDMVTAIKPNADRKKNDVSNENSLCCFYWFFLISCIEAQCYFESNGSFLGDSGRVIFSTLLVRTILP